MRVMADEPEEIEIELPNGAVAYILPIGEDVGASNARDQPLTLENIGPAIEGISEAVEGSLRKLAPDSWSLEFGLALTVKTGHIFAVFVSGQAEATAKVTLSWKKA